MQETKNNGGVAMTNIQKVLAQVVGVVLTLVGLVGFFTGETLIVFGINLLHNIVHLLALGIVLAGVGFGAKS
jgi:hypothetical protein